MPDHPILSPQYGTLLSRLLPALRHPAVDKLVALIACLPFIAVTYARLRAGNFNLPFAVLMGHMVLQIVPMLVRRTAVRVTPNPLYWLLAFLGAYWGFLTAGIAPPGRALAPVWAADGVSLLSVGVAAYARLSLGRNIGVVPAQRQVVSHGAYRFARHPIYTSVFISYLAIVLNDYSPANAAVCAGGVALFVVKSLLEERFLAQDAEYRRYMDTVRWRWVPGLF